MLICQFENGNKAPLRHVVVDSLVIKGNQILLAKRANHLLNGGKYGLIGGYVERDETIEQAAIREIREETGYDAKISYLLRIKDSPKRLKEDRQNIAFVFVATSAKKTGKSDSESSEVKWFELNKLPKPNEFAFDHYADIQMYLKQLNKLSQK